VGAPAFVYLTLAFVAAEVVELVQIAEFAPGQELVWRVDEIEELLQTFKFTSFLGSYPPQQTPDFGITFATGSILVESAYCRLYPHNIVIGFNIAGHMQRLVLDQNALQNTACCLENGRILHRGESDFSLHCPKAFQQLLLVFSHHGKNRPDSLKAGFAGNAAIEITSASFNLHGEIEYVHRLLFLPTTEGELAVASLIFPYLTTTYALFIMYHHADFCQVELPLERKLKQSPEGYFTQLQNIRDTNKP